MSYEVGRISGLGIVQSPARRVRGNRRGGAMIARRVIRDPRRAAANFYSTRVPVLDNWPPIQDPNMLAFSLRPPKWLRKGAKAVGKAVFKVAKVAVPLAAGALLAPAVVGLGVRAGLGAFKGVKGLARVGGAIFHKTSGIPAGSPSGAVFGGLAAQMKASQARQAIERAATEANARREQTVPTVFDAPVASSMPSLNDQSPQPTYQAMTATGPQAVYGDDGGTEADEAAATPPPTQAGVNPALVIGAIAIGALVLNKGLKGRR